MFIVASFAGVLAFANSASAASNSLVDISHVTLQGNRQQLAFTLSGPVPEPRSFTIDNPARIAIDLPDTSNDLTDRTVSIGSGLLQDVTTVEAGGRTRIVVNLASIIPYETAISGNQLLLTFSQGASGLAASTVNEAVPAIGAAVADNGSIVAAQQIDGHAIESIDFRRGPTGEGRVIFTLSSAGINTDMREEGGRIIVEFPDTELPDDFKKRLDVTDFGTPISYVDSRSNRRGTRIMIQPATQF